MEIPEKKKSVVLVDCPPKPEIDEELEGLIIVMRENATNVVVDFSNVNFITCSNISTLLKLHKFLQDEGHQLILSGLNPEIMEIFQKTYLHNVFEFTDDKSIALATFNIAS